MSEAVVVQRQNRSIKQQHDVKRYQDIKKKSGIFDAKFRAEKIRTMHVIRRNTENLQRVVNRSYFLIVETNFYLDPASLLVFIKI